MKERMEEAFWDGVMQSLSQDNPDFSWVLKLMKEVQNELCEMSPPSWRQEIVETVDINILSQVLNLLVQYLSALAVCKCFLLSDLLQVSCFVILSGSKLRVIGHGLFWKDFGICFGYFEETLSTFG